MQKKTKKQRKEELIKLIKQLPNGNIKKILRISLKRGWYWK